MSSSTLVVSVGDSGLLKFAITWCLFWVIGFVAVVWLFSEPFFLLGVALSSFFALFFAMFLEKESSK